MAAVPLAQVPTDPAGPGGGVGLDVAADRVCVLGRGLMGSRRGPCFPRSSLREVAAGPPGELREMPWMTAAAQVALDRLMATDPEVRLLAVAHEGPATVDVWLFRGSAEATRQARLLLASERPAADPPGAGAGGALRGGGVRAGLAALAVIVVVVGGAAWLLAGRTDDAPSAPGPPASPPSGAVTLAAAPYSLTNVVQALSATEVVRAGWRVSDAPRLEGGAALIPLAFADRPARLEVYPSFQAALGRAGGRSVQTGNVVVRYPEAARAEGLGVLLRAIRREG